MNAALAVIFGLIRLALALGVRTPRWVALTGVLMTLQGGNRIVVLLLMSHNFVTRLLPSLIVSLLPRNRLTALGALAGIIAGVATGATTVLTHSTTRELLPSLPKSLLDLDLGIVALGLNLLAMAIVSALTQPSIGTVRAMH